MKPMKTGAIANLIKRLCKRVKEEYMSKKVRLIAELFQLFYNYKAEGGRLIEKRSSKS
jgi:hypothetical protein